MPRPDDVVEAFLHHLAVERGSALNTLRSYTGDLERYAATCAPSGSTSSLPSARNTSAASSSPCATPVHGRPALAASSTARALAAVRGLHRFAAARRPRAR